MCDKHQTIDNRIIPLYVTVTLKNLIHITQGIQNIWCLTQKKWIMPSTMITITVYFLYKWNNFFSFQLHDSNKNNVSKAEAGFLEGV